MVIETWVVAILWKALFVCEAVGFIWKDDEVCSSRWPLTSRGIWRFYQHYFSTISSRILMSAVWIMLTTLTETVLSSNATFWCWHTKKMPVGSIFISPIYSHLIDWVTICTSFNWFILGYIVSMVTLLLIREHLFMKRVYLLICEELILHWNRAFHSVIWSVNGSHLVNYSMIFALHGWHCF